MSKFSVTIHCEGDDFADGEWPIVGGGIETALTRVLDLVRAGTLSGNVVDDHAHVVGSFEFEPLG